MKTDWTETEMLNLFEIKPCGCREVHANVNWFTEKEKTKFRYLCRMHEYLEAMGSPWASIALAARILDYAQTTCSFPTIYKNKIDEIRNDIVDLIIPHHAIVGKLERRSIARFNEKFFRLVKSKCAKEQPK